jgi:energy-coupling factor transporter ATP-binding protein EcfA2
VHVLLEQVTYTYEGAADAALFDIDLTINAGEWIAIVGGSGAGKTTLCRLLAGRIGGIADFGKIEGQLIRSDALAEISGNIGFVGQDAETGIVMEYVEDELAFGPENLCVPVDVTHERINAALLNIGLPSSILLQRTDQLSGGQQQRVAIAATLTMQPTWLIFDEVTANLDEIGKQQLFATQCQLHQAGYTLLTTSSRWDVAVSAASCVIFMDSGRFIASGKPTEVFEQMKDRLILSGCLPTPNPPHHADVSAHAPPFIQVQGLSFYYAHNRQVLPVLNNLSMSCESGEIIAITGPNGIGKSTFGKLIAGLLPAPVGAIRLRGRDLTTYSRAELAATVGYVCQQPNRQFIADTVIEECIYTLRIREKVADPVQAGERWLRSFGLLEEQHRHPEWLSLMKQRLLHLASVLIVNPALIILDEPTAGLDYDCADRFMQHCVAYAQAGGTILIITHDEHVIQRWATRQWRMDTAED